MEIGHYYKFHGAFEYGKECVGIYIGKDEESGFLMFSKVLRAATLERLREENKEHTIKNYKASEMLINPVHTNIIYPMKNYFEDK